MGYLGHGPLSDNKNALIEPIGHTKGHKSKNKTSLGFGAEDNLPIYDREPPLVISDSEGEVQPLTTISPGVDFVPSTSFLWGGRYIIQWLHI